MAALEDIPYLQKTIDLCHKEMKRLIVVFQEMNIEFILSAANFLTLIFEDEEEAASFSQAMLQRGIILRHLASWGHKDCIRLTVGTEEENKYFLEQLSSILEIN